jgi:hypothetical protein
MFATIEEARGDGTALDGCTRAYTCPSTSNLSSVLFGEADEVGTVGV